MPCPDGTEMLFAVADVLAKLGYLGCRRIGDEGRKEMEMECRKKGR